MRVLLTTDTIGGVWTFTRELTHHLLGMGHQVALVSFGRMPDSDQAAWIAGQQSRRNFLFEASALPLEWMEGNEIAMEGEAVLQQMAQVFAPDVLHSSQFCFGSLRLAQATVVTAHSDVLGWAEACVPGDLPDSAWLRQYKRLVQSGLEGADAVVAPTGWMLNALARNFDLPPVQQVILNGRDIDGGHTEQRKLQAVTAGRLWDAAKGLSVLDGIATPVPIVVAGDAQGEGSEAKRHEGVLYAGKLAERDLLALFRQSSLYLATSIYEPFGLAPLEAALCGCAVVARDLPSLREVWGDAALYFTDQASLSQWLRSLHDDPAMLLAARGRSSQRALQLSSRRMAESYVALYGRLLAGQGRTQEEIAYAC